MARSPKRPNHVTPKHSDLRLGDNYLQEFSAVPVPRTHAGRKSKRLLARLWERRA